MNKQHIAKKIIVGISGASGAIYGIRLLQLLRALKIESHLIISKAASLTITLETDYSLSDVKNLADHVHNISDIGACISSGSFRMDGMIIAPCSMKTLAGIANGYEDNLMIRAASVIMKEQKKLVLMVRETPLHAIALENMLRLSRAGVIISPPVPAFYNKPKTIDQLVDHSLSRVLDLFDIDTSLIKRWDGITN
jgi:4-hydroxy-3-polyprenylbenzoate decarboxylase